MVYSSSHSFEDSVSDLHFKNSPSSLDIKSTPPNSPWTPTPQSVRVDDGDPSNISHSEPPVSKTNLLSKLIPASLPCRLYLITVILQTVIDLAIEGDILFQFNKATKANFSLSASSNRRLPVYFTIFCAAHVFQLIMALDAVWMRNTIEFVFLAAFNLIFFVYSVVQIFEIQNLLKIADELDHSLFDIPIHVLTIILSVVIGSTGVIYVLLGYSIWREFGWQVYKRLGANRAIRKLYLQYQVLQCCMKFTIFFFAGFSIQLIWMVLQNVELEYQITIAALPASVVVLISGLVASRYEVKSLMVCFILACGGGLGYCVFKIFRVVSQRTNANVQPVATSLVSFAVITSLFLVGTEVSAFVVLRNFGKGLEAHLSKGKRQTTTTTFLHLGRKTQQEAHDMDVVRKRMSLD